VDVIILFMQPPHVEEVRLLGRIRVTDPSKPVLVVCEGLDINHCVELLKYGVEEVMSRSGDRTVLWKKVQRAIHRTNTFAFVSPTLRPLTEHLDPLPQHRNRRLSYRAPIPEHKPLFVVLLAHPLPIRMQVVNLSIPSEDGPGGMLLKDVEGGRGAGLFEVGADVGLVVEAPNQMLMGTCKVIRNVPANTVNPMMMSVTYHLGNLFYESAIQKIWVEVQRMSEISEKLVHPNELPEPAPKPQAFPKREVRTFSPFRGR
jgi:hypothetical protein